MKVATCPSCGYSTKVSHIVQPCNTCGRPLYTIEPVRSQAAESIFDSSWHRQSNKTIMDKINQDLADATIGQAITAMCASPNYNTAATPTKTNTMQPETTALRKATLNRLQEIEAELEKIHDTKRQVPTKHGDTVFRKQTGARRRLTHLRARITDLCDEASKLQDQLERAHQAALDLDRQAAEARKVDVTVRTQLLTNERMNLQNTLRCFA